MDFKPFSDWRGLNRNSFSSEFILPIKLEKFFILFAVWGYGAQKE